MKKQGHQGPAILFLRPVLLSMSGPDTFEERDIYGIYMHFDRIPYSGK